MKKIKLITSLSTLGVIATAVPTVATSCTSKGANYIVAANKTINLPDVVGQADINGLAVTTHTFSDGVPSRDALFINGEYVEADLITEIVIKKTDDALMDIPTNFISYNASSVNHGCTNLRKLDLHEVKITGSTISNLTLTGSANSLVELSVPTIDNGNISSYFLNNFVALAQIDL